MGKILNTDDRNERTDERAAALRDLEDLKSRIRRGEPVTRAEAERITARAGTTPRELALDLTIVCR